ncbi:hypothetical protein [Marinicella rhabdoformis]|uniref:hypothetical protein n=1 Tax=Marinicella rhabdoformis TaxID=2580566 RepID=UPI0012AEBC92|nr:hypothetical protein [Marinicella rhabdoformis]
MKHTLIIALSLGLASNALASRCIPEVKKSIPPRMVNGEWVQAEKPSAKALAKADFEQLKKKDYAFVFSGIYSKEASFSGKKLSFIKTKNIWNGKVKDTVDIEVGKPPTDPECSTLKYDQEYVFFAKLGGRNKPIHVKTFRKATPELKALLGKPKKQWLRGRLIHNR